ncbi:SMI1/KNR4 family protein [Xanthobacter sp. ZOL 2024]
MSVADDPVRSLARIEAWVARRHPDRLPLCRRGADAQTIRRIESRIGRPIPHDIRMLYSAHDGQPEGAPGLYLNQRWMPLDLVAVAWEDLCLRHGAGCEVLAGASFGGRPVVHAGLWSADWLPLFGSPCGDHYCVDLHTRQAGRSGRVIWFLHDQTERVVIADSVAQMLARIADGLEGGRWRLDIGLDGLSD